MEIKSDVGTHCLNTNEIVKWPKLWLARDMDLGEARIYLVSPTDQWDDVGVSVDDNWLRTTSPPLTLGLLKTLSVVPVCRSITIFVQCMAEPPPVLIPRVSVSQHLCQFSVCRSVTNCINSQHVDQSPSMTINSQCIHQSPPVSIPSVSITI